MNRGVEDRVLLVVLCIAAVGASAFVAMAVGAAVMLWIKVLG